VPEKAKLSVQKNKKGNFSGFLTFDSGKKMSLPSHFVVGPEHDGLECEVERDRNGQVVRVLVGGKKLPRRGERESTGGRGAAPEVQKETAGRGTGLLLPKETSLPSRTKELLKGQAIENFGLFLEKGVGYDREKEVFRFSLPDKKVAFGPSLIPNRSFFELLDKRRRQTIESSGLEFRRIVAHLKGRLVVGLGAESVYEVFLTLHPLYGFPYVPASAFKGAVRSAVIWKEFGGKEGVALADSLFCLVFGREEKQGTVRFFDGYPLEPPTVVEDVLNSHYAPYYQEGGKFPPGDYYHPVPVFFGAVEGRSWAFYVGVKEEVREASGEEPLNKVVKWLDYAFSAQGVGAKTSLGYGLMSVSAIDP